MILISHPHGNANVRAVLDTLNRRQWLSHFITTLGWSSENILYRKLPSSLKKNLSRRTYHLKSHQLITHPTREAARLLAGKLGIKSWLQHETGRASVDRIWQELDRYTAQHLKKHPAKGVYAYEDGALETFRTAKEKNIKCFYDLPIGYFETAQKIFVEERDLFPELASTLTGLQDSSQKLVRKKEEAEMADVILASSPFVKTTLLDAGFSNEKIQVVQFGCPSLPSFRKSEAKRPLRVLFVGRIGQRKGIGYLLKAIQQLPQIELWMLGVLEGSPEVWQPFRSSFKYLSPRPHAEVLEIMQQCDVFVLPSLFEGQALVVLEAMACGLPVIVTPNTGTAHLIEEGKNGFVVPIRSTQALIEKLLFFEQNRDAIFNMSLQAKKKASKVTWDFYQEQITSIIQPHLI